jgi:hypothetical protein
MTSKPNFYIKQSLRDLQFIVSILPEVVKLILCAS